MSGTPGSPQLAAHIKIMSNDKRVQPGVPTGGEFAAHNRDEGAPLSAKVGYGFKNPDASGYLSPEQIAMNVYVGIHSYPWLVHGDPMRDLLARGARAGIEYEQTRAATAARVSRSPEQIADEIMDDPHKTGINWNLYSPNREQVSDMITRGIREVQTTPDFKPDSESDDWRDDWDRFKHSSAPTISITSEDGEYTDFTISSDNLRRFLAMLSTESAE